VRKPILIAVVAVVAALYFSGRLDYALYNVGLNYHACARNGLGATFCGGDLTAYEARFQGIQRQEQSTLRTITQNERRQLQSITQAECQSDPSAPGCP
jgi:hypothetical protein